MLFQLVCILWTLQVWNLSNMLPIIALQRHEKAVHSMAVWQDSVFTGSEDMDIKVCGCGQQVMANSVVWCHSMSITTVRSRRVVYAALFFILVLKSLVQSIKTQFTPFLALDDLYLLPLLWQSNAHQLMSSIIIYMHSKGWEQWCSSSISLLV